MVHLADWQLCAFAAFCSSFWPRKQMQWLELQAILWAWGCGNICSDVSTSLEGDGLQWPSQSSFTSLGSPTYGLPATCRKHTTIYLSQHYLGFLLNVTRNNSSFTYYFIVMKIEFDKTCKVLTIFLSRRESSIGIQLLLHQWSINECSFPLS